MEAGLQSSFKGVGATVILQGKQGATGELRLLADFADILMGHTARPGTRIQYLQHFPVHRFDLSNELTINIIWGPGVTLGLVRDKRKQGGYLAAVSGFAGAEFIFHRVPVTVSTSFSADLGAHMTIRNRYDNTMTYYEYGLRRAWYPEIGIRYRF